MQLRNPKARRSGLAGVLGIEFNWAEGELQLANAAFAKVAVRYRGNGTYVNSLFGPKQSFKVDLNKLVKGQQLAGVRTLNFVNAIPDVSYMRDALAERLFRDLGVPAPRTSYAYLTLNGPGKFDEQPLGLYVLIENLDADYARDRFGSKDVPIFKPVTTTLFRDLGNDWRAYAPIYDLKTKATPAQWDRLIAFARLVTHAPDAEFAAQLGDFLDLEEFAGFLGGHVLLSAYDGFLANGQNFYMYLDPQSNKFGFISWDQDHSWGEFGYIGTADRRERASIWEPSTYDHRFLDRVLQVEEFRAIYRRRLERALADLFTVPRLYAQIDELAPIIRPAIAAESDFRLQRFDLAISTNWVAGPRDGVPEGPKAPVHQLKRFIVNRAASVRAQLDGTSEGVVLHRRKRR
jgi:spore coat protein CotH